MNKFKMEKYISLVTIVAICACLLTVPYHLYRGDKEISAIEKRILQKKPMLTVQSFAHGNYQKDLENYLADQFAGSVTLKSKYTGTKTRVVESVAILFHNINAAGNVGGYYAPLSSDVSIYRDADGRSILSVRLMRDWIHLSDDTKSKLDNAIAQLNSVSDISDSYFYFIEGKNLVDLEAKSNKHEMWEYYTAHLKGYKYDAVLIDDINDMYKYYYRTDHHWNNECAYMVYKNLCNMMGFSPLKPAGKIPNGIIFHGASARTASYTQISDTFSPYYFNYPNYNYAFTYLNREETRYGLQDRYLNDFDKILQKNASDIFCGHYGEYYGYDPKIGIIQNKENRSGKKLLMVGSSTDNAIVQLMASHFETTYTVDPRHYKDFNLADFIRKHKVTTFLYTTSSIELVNGEGGK
jgi:hypothetical protein